MWIPVSTAKSLVDSISDIIKHKHHLIGADVKENLEQLKTQLQKLLLLMPNFFDSEWHDSRPYIMETVGDIRPVLDRCEDAVDYVYSSCRRYRSILNLMLLTDAILRRTQISNAKAQIQVAVDVVKYYINEEIIKKGYDQVLYTRGPAQNFSTAHRVGDERVIGFEKAAAEVVALLTTGAEHLEVISIVGMHGMGKTTLAKMTYEDPEVQYQFKIRAFVSISQLFNGREVLLKVLNSFAQLDDEKTKDMGVYSLISQIHRLLKGKQYLIVLDSIWLKWDWNILKDAFPNNTDKRCRVVVTTREVQVAEHVSRSDSASVYMMEFMTLESSKILLRWLVFGENDFPEKLQEQERDIVIKCTGLPQALLSVASMILKNAGRVEWWKTVADTLRTYRARDPLQVLKPVQHAYRHLPNHLKPCFLYLAAFPREFEIPVWKLLRLWIAEGLIVKLHDQECVSHNLELEEIAEQYLEELVCLNFVMVSRRRSNGRIGICKMNGKFNEFCRMVASEERVIMDEMDRSIFWRQRRIAIHEHIVHDYILEFLFHYKSATDECIRSLLMFSLPEIEVDHKNASHMLKRFQFLKVLDPGSLFFTSLPVELWSLVLLKYLAISGRIVSLPSTLSCLWSLQTLIVKTTSRTLEIKADIWEMPHFRHLHTNASATFPCQNTSKSHKSTEEGGTNFQTLCYISPQCCKKEVFYRATKLKKLGISGKLAEFFESGSLEYLHKLENLENLKLLNCNKFPGLPPKIRLPKQLTKLTLSNTRLSWKDMHTLGEMDNLEILKLKEYAFVGECWKTENGGFLRLKHLHIGHTDLMVWEASADHFPQLRSLEISECDMLYRVPHSLADILSLQSVSLHRSTSPGVTYSLKRIRLVKFLQAKQASKKEIFKISVFPPVD